MAYVFTDPPGRRVARLRALLPGREKGVHARIAGKGPYMTAGLLSHPADENAADEILSRFRSQLKHMRLEEVEMDAILAAARMLLAEGAQRGQANALKELGTVYNDQSAKDLLDNLVGQIELLKLGTPA